jgi:hypothetical protein
MEAITGSRPTGCHVTVLWMSDRPKAGQFIVREWELRHWRRLERNRTGTDLRVGQVGTEVLPDRLAGSPARVLLGGDR